jgi:hypothetical protein
MRRADDDAANLKLAREIRTNDGFRAVRQSMGEVLDMALPPGFDDGRDLG